jgi:hypothetical protein
LTAVNLSRARLNVDGLDLKFAHFLGANLSGAELNGVVAFHADFCRANLQFAKLHGANLHAANFYLADLSGADLQGADLSLCQFVETRLAGASLDQCKVYGVSVWASDLASASQHDMIITSTEEPIITVDTLEVAQFIYLLLNNNRIRRVIDTITSKVVLILGNFKPERKAVLDAIRDELRKRDYLPVLFDFEKPSSRDITETISTLAHMARFVIADITDAKSIPQELMEIVPDLPSVPVQPLLLASQQEYGMFEHFKRFPWVLEPYLYEDQDGLLLTLNEKVIGPAEKKAKEQTMR